MSRFSSILASFEQFCTGLCRFFWIRVLVGWDGLVAFGVSVRHVLALLDLVALLFSWYSIWGLGGSVGGGA